MDSDKLRQRCWNEALESYGTAYIFERRADRYRNRLKLLSFLGIAVPLTIGASVATFGSNLNAMFLTSLGVLSIFQLIGTAWSLVAKWEDNYAYSQESMTSNARLARQYERLGESPPQDISEFQIRYDLLEVEANQRSDSDLKQGIPDAEKRLGMRAALRRYQRACVSCKEIPTSMKPSNCPVCGNFKVRKL